MLVSINNPLQQTVLFALFLIAALFVLIRRKKENSVLPLSTTQELKGLAILAVIFVHVGYFLASDHQFLFPFSIFGGVGVDLFLLLSGFGLVSSALKREESTGDFYKRKLRGLFVPMWIVLGVLMLLAGRFILPAFFGIFLTADIYKDLNSPLWYFTLILFYYIFFPLVFSKKRTWFSALVLYVIPYFIVQQDPALLSSVIGLYKVHLIAFPLGVLAGGVLFEKKLWVLPTWIRWVLISCAVALVAYLSVHSGILESPLKTELISIVMTLCIIFAFVFKKIEFGALSILGLYSYEIYLIHWPIMYHYDFLFSWLPAGVATFAYLGVFIALGMGLKKLAVLR